MPEPRFPTPALVDRILGGVQGRWVVTTEDAEKMERAIQLAKIVSLYSICTAGGSTSQYAPACGCTCSSCAATREFDEFIEETFPKA